MENKTNVELMRDMIFLKYRNAKKVTHEPEVRIMTSEALMLSDMLSDYLEILRNEKKRGSSEQEGSQG